MREGRIVEGRGREEKGREKRMLEGGGGETKRILWRREN